jgi:putative transcriptional regulator
MSSKDAIMKPKIADQILQRLQGFTQALEKNESIAKRFTCHKIVLNLRPKPYTAEMVKTTRALLSASQRVFAQILGTSVRTVRAWEQGINPPQPMACRFMDEIRQNPSYWLDRLKKAIVAK